MLGLSPSSERLLVVAESQDFLSVIQRACDVTFEGDCEALPPEGLADALAGPPPRMVIVHGDELDDRGRVVVTRMRGAARFERVPILVVGAGLGVLDRWHLAAAGAFAVPLPVTTVDMLATVIAEALPYAGSSPDDADPSHPRAQLQISADFLGRLPVEAFLLLIAIAWSGRGFPYAAMPAVVDAASEQGHDGPALEAVVEACATAIPLVDADASDLAEADRWYLYAFGLWVSLHEEPRERDVPPTVQVLGHTLGVSPRVRAAIRQMVDHKLQDGTRGDSFRLEEFRAEMLPELEYVAGQSMLPPPPEPAPFAADDDVMEMPDDAIVDDAAAVAS